MGEADGRLTRLPFNHKAPAEATVRTEPQGFSRWLYVDRHKMVWHVGCLTPRSLIFAQKRGDHVLQQKWLFQGLHVVVQAEELRRNQFSRGESGQTVLESGQKVLDEEAGHLGRKRDAGTGKVGGAGGGAEARGG